MIAKIWGPGKSTHGSFTINVFSFFFLQYAVIGLVIKVIHRTAYALFIGF